MKTKITPQEALALLPLPNGRHDAEVGRRGTLIVEMYAPKGTDPQQPHNQDELYVIYRGQGTFFCDGTRTPFNVGDVLFVPAGVEHRFENFSGDFATWVIFYGETGGELALPSAIAEGENPPPDSALNRNALLWRTRTAYAVLTDFLDSLSESQATDLKDAAGWAIKDHVLHLVPWMRSMIWVLNKRPKVDGMGVTEAHFSDALKEMLAAKGFDPLMGARPMARLIQDTIRSALADELLFGKLASGGKVTVDIDKDEKVKLVFEEEPADVVV